MGFLNVKKTLNVAVVGQGKGHWPCNSPVDGEDTIELDADAQGIGMVEGLGFRV